MEETMLEKAETDILHQNDFPGKRNIGKVLLSKIDLHQDTAVQDKTEELLQSKKRVYKTCHSCESYATKISN